MYVKVNDVFKMASAWIKESAVLWRRVDGLVKIDGAWRGWFRKSGSLASVTNDTWENYDSHATYVYVSQWRWITKSAFLNPIRFVTGSFSARVENRDEYAQSYGLCIEGKVGSTWVTLATADFVVDAQRWQTLSVDASVSPIEITQVRYGIRVKHLWDQANGSVTGWEEFGTYTG